MFDCEAAWCIKYPVGSTPYWFKCVQLQAYCYFMIGFDQVCQHIGADRVDVYTNLLVCVR